MGRDVLKEIKELISNLSYKHRVELMRYLKGVCGIRIKEGNGLIKLKEEVNNEEGISCPHCKSSNIICYGKYRGRNRYKCKGCGKTFNELTGSPMSGTHYLEKWKDYLICMLAGKSLRKIEKELSISLPTAFYWRHKILNAFMRVGFDKLEGIVEADETYFLYSEKGKKKISGRKARKRGGKARKRGISNEQVAVITSCDRKGNSIIEVGCLGRISQKDVDRTLGQYIDSNNTLCTDSHPTYKAFAKTKGINFETVNLNKGYRVREKIYHIQTVNSLHSRLKNWIRRFNGVATKYLSNYMIWFRILEKIKNKMDELREITKYTLIKKEIITINKIGLVCPQYI